MRPSLLTAVLLASLRASLAVASTAATEPIGFTAQTLAPGAQTVGLTLNNPALFAATVEDNDGDSLLLDTADAVLGSVLGDATHCYAEITGGEATEFIGDRFDIDVTATRLRGTSTLVLRAAAHNTIALPLPAHAFAGARVTIKRHLTLGQVFGTHGGSSLQGSSDFEKADQVLTYNSATGGFVIHYLFRSAAGTIEEWRQVGATGSRDDVILPPATGLFVRRNATTAAELVLEGTVRTNDFVLPLAAGYNFIALPFPTDASPVALQMTSANGFAGGSEAAQADQVLVFNGTAYDTWFLAADTTGSTGQWRRDGGASGATDTQSLRALASFFIRKGSADPDFVVSRALRL